MIGYKINQPADSYPVISLIGSASISLIEGGTYTELGATAKDRFNVDISNDIVISGTLDEETPGDYTKTYTVEDRFGLSASTTRAIHVLPTIHALDPLFVDGCTLSNNDNTVTSSAAGVISGTRGAVFRSTGIRSFTVTIDSFNSNSNNAFGFGIGDTSVPIAPASFLNASHNNYMIQGGSSYLRMIRGSGYTDVGGILATSDEYKVEVNFSVGTVTFYKKAGSIWNTVGISNGVSGSFGIILWLYSMTNQQMTVDATNW